MVGVEELALEGASLRAVAGVLMHCRHDIDDAVQEGWLRIFQGRGRSSGRSLSWMAGVVRNVARSMRRERATAELMLAALEAESLATDELAE